MQDIVGVDDRTPFERLDDIFTRDPSAQELGTQLGEALDVGIEIAGADKGTLQLLDRRTGCLKIAASRGFAPALLQFFETVTPDSPSSCASTLKTRMRVIIEDVSTSYLLVGSPALQVMRAAEIGAAHSTPLIGGSGQLWGVFTTHWRQSRSGCSYDPAPLDRLALRVADHLDRRAAGAVPGR
jgi:GAF domain-containing protein